jgi:hypothetical protein
MTLSESSPGREVGPFPTMSIFAVITIPLLALASWPFWIWYVDRQIKSVESNAPDPGQFGGFAVAGGVVMTAAVAAVLGLAIAWFAARRKERWRGVRILAWTVNGLGTALGAALALNYIMNSSR